MFVPKGPEEIRLVVDYRRLNNNTIKDLSRPLVLTLDFVVTFLVTERLHVVIFVVHVASALLCVSCFVVAATLLFLFPWT